MSDIIHLLPDSVANQIAAGEVIQRPASVVKELVENAIDAGATNIQVLVTDAGKTCIQVVDDGKGMSETDARLSFERHATSKISQASDLFALRTMGFRGEALASIAAVSEVELKTCQAGAEIGTRLVIAGSKVETQEVCACPQGCNFQVKNLFFNVPARRKFLKANSTELSNVVTEFERIALVHPEVSFSLYSNDSELLNLPASSLRQRILNVFGKKLNQQLLSIDVETSLTKITGFVAKPDTARKKGAHQYFFVNGRYMRHPYFHKAVMEPYDRLIPTGEQVSYFIYFDVEPANIDVNIHPTKTEIKFENEHAIWQILSATVKEALGRFNAVPSIDFDTEDMPDIPAFDANTAVAPPKVNYDAGFNPFKSSRSGSHTMPAYERKISSDWQSLYDGIEKSAPAANAELMFPFEEEIPSSAISSSLNETNGNELLAPSPVVESGAQFMQFKGRYILTSVKSGLMLIDQHRAHLCVLYERYMRRMALKQGMSQGVLFPEVIQLPASEATVLDAIFDDLSAVGFELSPLGGGSYAINGVPSGIEGLNPVELVRNMVHTALEKGFDVREEVQSLLALTLARAAAIVYGQVLTNDEMASLVGELFALPSPGYTPDGHVVLSTIKEEDIQKLF